MPIRNTIKKYRKGGVYHIYNRGTDRDFIFNKEKDYTHFVYLLEKYLLPQKQKQQYPTFAKTITLYAYVLLPNHIHLVIKQHTKSAMPLFIKSLLLSYSLYATNKKHKKGPLCESRYKGRYIKNTRDFLGVIRYVHNNPRKMGIDATTYRFCSLQTYLSDNPTLQDAFVNTEILKIHFNNSKEKYLKHLL